MPLSKNWKACLVHLWCMMYIHITTKDGEELFLYFNIGIECIDNKKYASFIENWRQELEVIQLEGIQVESKFNDVFYGRGYNLEYITTNFKNTLVLATEISKIYCDEETGEIYPQTNKKYTTQSLKRQS